MSKTFRRNIDDGENSRHRTKKQKREQLSEVESIDLEPKKEHYDGSED